MTRAMLFLCLPVLCLAADVNGKWKLHLVRFGEEFAAARVELKNEGTKVTGTLNELTLEGDQLRLTAIRPDGKEWGKFEGRVQGDDVSGTVKQGSDELGWKAHRTKESAVAPKTHTFEPTVFHRAFSGSIPPVLHINP